MFCDFRRFLLNSSLFHNIRQEMLLSFFRVCKPTKFVNQLAFSAFCRRKYTSCPDCAEFTTKKQTLQYTTVKKDMGKLSPLSTKRLRQQKYNLMKTNPFVLEPIQIFKQYMHVRDKCNQILPLVS